MEFNYVLSKEDLLAEQLYVASRSKLVRSQWERSKWILVGIFSLCALLALSIGQMPLFWGGLAGTLYLLLSYKSTYKNAQKRICKKYVEEHLLTRVGVATKLSFGEQCVKIQDLSGFSQIYLHQLEQVVEVPEQFLLKLKMQGIIIVPKQPTHELTETRRFFQILCHRLGMEYRDELDWKW